MDSGKREEILEVATRMGPTKASAAKIRNLLPTEQEDVDHILDAAADVGYRHTFMTVATAAIEAGFRLDAKYLERASIWAEGEIQVILVGWHASGDAAGVLLQEGLSGRLPAKLAIGCALTVARLIKEQNAPFPMEDCWNLVRRLYRTTTPQDIAERIMLVGVVEYTREPDLYEGLLSFAKKEGDTGQEVADKGMEWRNAVFDAMDKPLLDLMGTTFSMVGKGGSTVRRASKKIGRNKRCPCGSGRKYKHCCLRKDEERSRLASNVAGKTLAEADKEKEDLLSEERIKAAMPSDLAQMDPTLVEPRLREPLLRRLCEGQELGAIAEFAEKVEWSDDYRDLLAHAAMLAARRRETVVLARLLAVCGEQVVDDEGRLAPPIELLQAEGEPEKYIELLKEFSTAAVDDSDRLQMMALALLCSRVPHLGIIVARTAVLLADNKAVRNELVKDLMFARDSLKLPYKDALQDLMDRVFDDEGETPASEEMADLSAEMKSLRSAERRLRKELAEQKRKLRLAEKKADSRTAGSVVTFPQGTTVAGTSATPDDDRLKKLKTDRAAMQEILRGVQAERTDLRKKLEAMREQQEKSLQAADVAPTAEDDDELESDSWDATLEPGARRVRLPAFSKRFRNALRGLSPRVVRAALKRIGAMASGEAAAYVGEEQLQDNRTYRRLRIEKDYRLLYRFDGDNLLVADLVHRSKLDQAVFKLRGDQN